MFEDYVLYLLRKYLGEYVHDLSTEALRISVWKGDVVLKDLKLKAEALNALKLPVIVHAGFIGSITLKVPWKRLGKEPVVVFIDRIFLLAHPAPDGETLKEEDREKLFEAKLQRIEEAELATLEATARKSKGGSAPGGNSWLGSLIATIIGNLKISITNVHIRYEDTVSNPGHPFSSGLTLSKLAAVTVDEEGIETFDASGALDNLRKSLQLHRLAVYHDSDGAPWKLDKRWEDLNSGEWTEIFADGIDESHVGVSVWASERKFLVAPVNGTLKYHRIGKKERNDPGVPLEKASLALSDVSLTVSEAQYYDGIKLLETFSRYKTRIEVSHLRPVVSVFDDPSSWWRYLAQASLQQKKMCYRFSWERIRHLCQLRRKYVQLYASSLQHMTLDVSEGRQIEKNLDSKVILLWRLLAHAKVESVRSKEAAQQNTNLKRNWWSLRWLSSSGDASITSNSVGKKLVDDERLSKEEWESLNKLLTYHLDEDATYFPGKDMQTVMQFLVDVSIGQAAARIISINQTEILCGKFDQLQVTAKLYYKSVQCDLSLRFYGLSAPEGALAESVSNEKTTHALAATFVHSPASENVDWRLSATIAPCHVTVLMESYERFLEFLKRSNAVSPAVALETATALQMKIEKVTRRAQEQLQLVLEEKNRFALDIDFDGPKLRIPMKGTGSAFSSEDFLLDFGHFTLHTREYEREEQRQSLYSRFYISVRDIAAFFMDASIESTTYSVGQAFLEQASVGPKDLKQFYSVIDRCGMSVVVDMIKIPQPKYPSTRVSFQVPSLCIHFSPARYWRILALLNMFYSSRWANDLTTTGCVEPSLSPWYTAELATNARTLVWRGIGNTSAEWKPCFILLSGIYLYVLESEVSQNYQRCTSMAGRQVFEVPSNSVGGSLFSLAVSCRGKDMQKALESSNTLIIEFQSDTEKAVWLRGLVQATYRASAPPDIDILGVAVHNESESFGAPISNEGKVDLVINGALIETSLSIYGKLDRSQNVSEEIILELLAGGGKVNLVCSETDLIFKMKLHSLKVKDELQSRLSMTPQYLACSVLMDNLDTAAPHSRHADNKVSHTFPFEDDDIFKDALPEFVSTPDQALCAQYLDPSPRPSDFLASDVFAGMNPDEPSNQERDRSKKIASEVFYEAEDNGSSDFITLNFLTRNPDSSFYDGIDTQMTICMSKLDFFCNRPTLVALIAFGFDLSSMKSEVSSADNTNVLQDVSSQAREKTEESGSNVIKGLLGHGKGRVVFNLSMDVDSVCIFLNKEDGSRLALFVQENFLLDIKVHPNSLSIEGALGNLRLCDLSLGQDHCWGWLCDLRNQGMESLINFTFQSYSTADDDYDGYDYSLYGRLSAVRIIFLYRFVQEITSYFMELATPRTDEAVRFVDKVGDFEWLIQKYEIDGASAIKLDMSLHTPIIIVPRDSSSKDFLQLDLGQLRLCNSFSWHGCHDTDTSAVHLDILHIEVHGINMAVGINGLLGRPMIREAQGLNIYIRRSLRDVFRKVPTAYVEVKVALLHCLMSDKEYNVILDCAYMNISEEPKLPPSFRDAPKDPMRILADKVQINSQILLSRTVAVFVLEIQNALLDLHNCLDEESPLAHVALEGLWLSYRRTSLFETDIYLTIPKLSILDIRPDTKPEMRLMLGSSSDAARHGIFSYPSLNDDLTRCTGPEADTDHPNLTMLIMDYHFRSSSQSLVIRIQQPRILAVLDFLLPAIEFFVPALGVVTGREETMHAQNDPLTKCDDLILSESIYMQQTDAVYLSPTRRLIVDGCGDEFIYDGCGGTIHLSDGSDSKTKSSGTQPTIILIGRGKKLRFKNVKFENGTLLRKCTWLGNDSSYSVSADDRVEISLLQSDTYAAAEETLSKSHEYGQKPLECAADSSTEFNETKSSSFEIQVMSLEFIFYDSTKLSVDDALHIEKLLRAKMDLSFIYAAKENDMWIRALLKHLTVEAGTGLVVLDPVDISGGYTSFKDKTNISIMPTDIYIRLSLGVASLLLQLQSQATEALQFGNANPLAICTNFKRLWVSHGKTLGCNLTFWRPQAPSNFAILGDCVTSRSIPPSQVVMAVSTTYGRVRKPVGFKFICSISDLLRLEDGECIPGVNNECCLWMPVAPPGYSAIGCVAHVGSQPPPNHIVYCIRSDLISSTAVSDCFFSVQPHSRFPSGFSIWHIDNSVGSFFAHSSIDYPPKINCFDFHQVMLSNSDVHVPFKAISNDSVVQENTSTQEKITSSSTSGWDIVRSLQRTSSLSISTPHFERMWWDKGCEFCRPVSIWRPLPRPGFSVLSDCIVEGLEPPALGLLFKFDNTGISARPEQFTKVAHIFRKGLDEAFVWYPIAPPGYASLGCIITKTDEVPETDSFCCPRLDLVNQANISAIPISRSSSSKGPNCWSIWKVENQAYSFLVQSDLKKPSARLAYNISDFLKPKTRANVSAEMKLGCFSFTALDSLYGMLMPILDMTITNINVATHGRLDAMSAVLICSTAASTFNRQLEAWEPLVEPFDGIFKLETYDMNELPPSRTGKRVRFSTTTTVNLNLSSANLETVIESLISWRKQMDLQQRSSKKNEEPDVYLNCTDGSKFSALEEDDLQRVIVENKLGCSIYIRKLEQNTETVELLDHGKQASVAIPPPRFSDQLNSSDDSRENRYYFAIKILESKGVPIEDDGNAHDFFCALRLMVDSNLADKSKLFPQSARTRCVRPIVSRGIDVIQGIMKWNEIFIFEIPEKGLANLEVEVTNLASRAGKGEIIGAISIPIGGSSSRLKRVASIRMLQHLSDMQKPFSYSLKPKGQHANEGGENCGSLLVSYAFFERNTIANFQREIGGIVSNDRDVSFWVGLGPEGPWVGFGSLLPASVVPRPIGEKLFAFEVVMKNGKKHAILRPLATVINDTDIKMEISTCPSVLHNSASGMRNSNIEEKEERRVLGVLSPGSSAILPWSSMQLDSDDCLQIRPYVEHPGTECTWGQIITLASGSSNRRDEGLTDQRPVFRQGSTSMVSSVLKLGQLEKKDMIMNSQGSSNKQHFWLSVGTDASVLHTDLNVPVYDWKISINAPLKLDNKLPCNAEYAIWERTVEGNRVERHHGIMSACSSGYVYSADLRRPIYLTLFLQGGWILERDAILIMDLSATDYYSFFWIVHQQSKRRLRVSIERDMGGSDAAPKTVRLFVPYWITNDTSLPLEYRVVEVETLESVESVESVESDFLSVTRAAKSAKSASKHTPKTINKKIPMPHRNFRTLEIIEDSGQMHVMLSPQDYIAHTGSLSFPSRNDTFVSPRVGVAVALRDSELYSAGISLAELENKERVNVKAFSKNGAYYKLSVLLTMASNRTKVIHFQHQSLFINRIGQRVSLKQCNSEFAEWLDPFDPPRTFKWQSSTKAELLMLRLDGYEWSMPFSVENEGVMGLPLKNDMGNEHMYLRVEVCNGTKSSHLEIVFCLASSFSSPYRIENHSMYLPLRIRQVDGNEDAWRSIPPNAAVSYYWEDLGRKRLLEVIVDGSDPIKSEKYNIDQVMDHLPCLSSSERIHPLHLTVTKEGKTSVCKIRDWMPDSETITSTHSTPKRLSYSYESDYRQSYSMDSEFHVVLELADVGLSIIDHTPEEILYLTIQNLLLSYSSGLGSGISRFKLRMSSIQVDNQLPFTPMPVLLRPQKAEDHVDYLLKFSVTVQSSGSPDSYVYPHVGLQGFAFLVNIHEPIFWRLHEMLQQAKISRLYGSQTTDVSIDPIIQIGLLNISEIRFKVSMSMSPAQRPRGVLGFWSSLMTALGNTENMPVRINQRFHEDICMRQSALIASAISNIQKDLLSQPLQLLSGVDILGNASSAFGNMSKGMAALSMDKKFIQSRQKQESKGVEDIGDVIREGGGAFAKGLFRGVTGILTKPVEGAKSSGVEGFVQGVGKGIIGAAAQPVSGVLDLLSKTTEGANAVKMKLASALTSEEQPLRRRLPRAIGGDNLLCPYDEYKATGQAILQLAESGAFLGQVDLFKVRGKFALSDAYEDHFLLGKGKILVVTHRRVLLLQQPFNIGGQKKFNPARDACSVLWDTLWNDLVTTEVVDGKNGQPKSSPSLVILYLKARPSEPKEGILTIECGHGSCQANDVYSSIDRALCTYGPNSSKGMQKKKVNKPYSPHRTAVSASVFPEGGHRIQGVQEMSSRIL